MADPAQQVGQAIRDTLAGLALGLLSLALLAGMRPAPGASEPGSTAPSRLHAEAPAGGSSAALPRPVGPGDYDAVASYRMTARLDPKAHVVDGQGVISWSNRSTVAQSEIYLHLYLNAFRSDGTVFMRSDQAAGFRGAGPLSSPGQIDISRLYARELERDLWPDADAHTPDEPADQTDIRVPLPEPVAPGDGLTLEVRWRAQLPALVLRTGHVERFHMVAQWFPKLARLEPDGRWAHFPFERLSEFYADFGDYDVTIEAPVGYVVGATGKLVSREPAGGLERHRYVQPGVHDFAFAAWDEFGVLERTTADGVALRCLFPPGEKASARLELEAAAATLGFFGTAYGAYPYEVLTVVHPPEQAMEAGGMEYPTLITTGGEWYWPWIGVRYLEQVTVHELGHQWFYGLVATDESRYPFLDEGLTTYAEMRGLERLHPGSSAAGALGLQISLTAAARLWASEAWDEDVIAKPAADFATGSEYGALVYAKAALLLATLERAYGREKFDAALGRYAREHRFGHPRPEQLIAAVQAELGAGAAEQLRTGVYERSWVDYAVERVGARRVAVSASEPEGSTGDGRQRATHRRAAVADGGPWESFVDVRRRGSLAFPVVVELATSSGSRHRIEWDGQEARARLTVRTTEPVRAAVVDPDYRVLLDRDWSNNARSAAAPSPAAQIAPRVWAYAAHAAQLVLSGVAP